MYPHERSLVQKMQGKPFVLLGVNSDQTRAIAKQATVQEHLTWRSWFAGSGGGAIATTYGVRSWPTLLVLDGKGVIRYRHVGSPPGDTLEKEIETLLREIENGT